MPVIVDSMRVEDIPQVLDIERESFSMAWSAAAYKREIRWNKLARYVVAREVEMGIKAPQPPAGRGDGWRLGRWVSSLQRWFAGGGTVPAIQNCRILGYAGMWLMVDEAHLITIAVGSPYRRKGIGERLLIAIIDGAVELGARMVTLEVRVSNSGAQTLYEKYGFQKVGIRPHYYSDDNEDALLMTSETITSAPFRGHFQRLKEANQEKLNRLSEPWSPPT